jgi:hypothetical protein
MFSFSASFLIRVCLYCEHSFSCKHNGLPFKGMSSFSASFLVRVCVCAYIEHSFSCKHNGLPFKGTSSFSASLLIRVCLYCEHSFSCLRILCKYIVFKIREWGCNSQDGLLSICIQDQHTFFFPYAYKNA